jgi:hypothetical protein
MDISPVITNNSKPFLNHTLLNGTITDISYRETGLMFADSIVYFTLAIGHVGLA